MKFLTLLLFVTICIFANCEDEDPNVITLTDKNFDEEIKKYDALLIEIYAPWCGHCKELAPEYSRAAEILKNENSKIHLAKIDGTENQELSKRFEVEGFPTLKLYKNGEYSEFNGGRTAEEIVMWMKKKTGPVVTSLKTLEELEQIANENEAVVVFFGCEYQPEFATYKKVAEQTEQLFFVNIAISEAITKYEVQNGDIVLLTKFDEKKYVYSGNKEEKDIKEFIDTFSVPLVSNFSEKVAEYVFGKNKPLLLFLRSKENPEHMKLEETFRSLAPKFKGKLHFSLSDITEEIEKRLAEYYGITEDDFPQIRITDVKSDEDVLNYILPKNKEINETNLVEFINDYLHGVLKPFIKSEEIPETQNEKTYNVVGKSFDDVVIHSEKSVVMEFYAPWCPHCKEFAEIYDKIADHYKGNDKILIAKMDATANEVEGLVIHGYPTFKIYVAGNKKNAIDFEGERTFKELVRFIDFTVFDTKTTFEDDENEVEPETTVGDDENTFDDLYEEVTGEDEKEEL